MTEVYELSCNSNTVLQDERQKYAIENQSFVNMYIGLFFLTVGNFNMSCEVFYKHIYTLNDPHNEHVQISFIIMHIDTIEVFFGKLRV